MAQGWQREILEAEGLPRILLWKGPAGPWTKGAILVLHGGGGRHHHFCVANAPIIAPQVGFTRLALSQGFAVFLLDSSDRMSDDEGRSCGKVWDDERRERPNLDLPFSGHGPPCVRSGARCYLTLVRPATTRSTTSGAAPR